MLVVLAVLAARRRRTRAAAAPGLGALVLGSVLACGVNLLLVGLKGANNDVSRWPLWSIPSLLCVALGIVLFKTDSGPGARIRTAVRDLSPTEADVVRRQVRDALEMLHSRRILRDEEVARAKGVELGMLSLSMFPLDQKTPQRR
jgi:MFS family permease